MIVKPESDDRVYKHITLQNQLKVLLISDPSTEKASCALSVAVGSLNEPADWNGLAHFLEHMLFMGTETFPQENEYSSHLNKNGGYSNAYTAAEETNYFFEVTHLALKSSLDRFCAFFKCPLLGERSLFSQLKDKLTLKSEQEEDAVQREMKAVDSEFKKNLQNDYWRTMQVFKAECDSEHPYSKFDIGNLKSLQMNISRGNVHQALRSFFELAYSADLMTVVILGREPVEQLELWAVECFEGVKLNQKAKEFKYSISKKHPGADVCGKQIYIKPVKDVRTVDLEFSLPPQLPNKWTKPGGYISHLIGHESQGSLLSWLKQKNWASSLSAGSGGGSDFFDFFSVKISLSEEGLANYQQVVASVFSYIRMLVREGFQERIYLETRIISEMHFRFKEKGSSVSSYASKLATQLYTYGDRPELVLMGDYFYPEGSTECRIAVDDIINKYLVPSNLSIMIIGPEAPVSLRQTKQKTEQWFGVDYSTAPFGDDFMNLLEVAQPFSDLQLPRPNPYVPKQLSLVIAPSFSDKEHPRVILNSPFVRLWHGVPSKNVSLTPKQYINMDIKSPLAYAPSPLNAVLSQLFGKLVGEELAEEGYEAELALIRWHVEHTADGFNCQFSGVGDGVKDIVKMVISCMRQMPQIYSDQSEPRLYQERLARFEVLKDKALRDLTSFAKEQPHKLAIYFTTQVLQECIWTPMQKLEALKNVTLDQVCQFARNVLWQNVYIEMLCFGNATRASARLIGQLVHEVFSNDTHMFPSEIKSISIHPSLRYSNRSHVLPEGKEFVLLNPSLHADNPNSAIEVFFQVNESNGDNMGSTANPRLRSLIFVLSTIMQEPAFDQLRTKEQLGYIVFAGVRKSINSLGLRVIVQSERDSVYVESRVEQFIQWFGSDYLKNLDEASFAKYVESCIILITQKDKSMSAEFGRYQTYISNGYFEFDQVETDTDAFKSVTLAAVKELFYTFISAGAVRRSKFSTHISSFAGFKNDVKLDLVDTVFFKNLQLLLRTQYQIYVSDMELVLLAQEQQFVLQVETNLETLSESIVVALKSKSSLEDGKNNYLVPDNSLSEKTVFVDEIDAFKRTLMLSAKASPLKPEFLKVVQEESKL